MLHKYRCSPDIDRMPHVFEAAYRAASIKNGGSKFPTHHQLLGPHSQKCSGRGWRGAVDGPLRLPGARVGPCGTLSGGQVSPGMIHAVRRGGQHAGE